MAHQSAEAYFHGAFTCIFAVLAVLRVYYHLRARTWDGKRHHVIGNLFALQAVLTPLTLTATLMYIVDPDSMEWSGGPMPNFLRWVGVYLSAFSVVILWWVQHSLGKYFSPLVSVRPDHQLVVEGPYRWVRHPMYSAIALLSSGMWLLSANWLIGALMIFGIGLVMFLRTPLEEEMLLGVFGEEYRRYMQRTPRFIPNFDRPVPVIKYVKAGKKREPSGRG